MADTDPATQMRKIELSTSADMRYLISRIAAAAQQKINTHVPAPNASRQPIEHLISQYVTDIFTLAYPSISVNGNPAPPPGQQQDEELEPYDKALAKEVHDTYAMIERRTLEVAMLRREVPEAYRRSLMEALGEEARKDQVVVGKMREKMLEEDAGGEVNVPEVSEEVAQTAERARRGFERAKGRLPEVTSRLTRARSAAAYVAEKRG